MRALILSLVMTLSCVSSFASDTAWEPGETRCIPNFFNNKMNGYICTKVEPGSVYSQMGLQKGDVVVEINGKSMVPIETGMDNWREFDKSETATVLIERAGHQLTLKKPQMRKN